MTRVSLNRGQLLRSVRVYKADNKFCIEVEIVYSNNTEAKGVAERWGSLEEAIIYAKGISKMFGYPAELVKFDI